MSEKSEVNFGLLLTSLNITSNYYWLCYHKIARQRKQFHFELVKQILTKYDAVFVEDLTVKNMVRRNKPKQDEKGNYLPHIGFSFDYYKVV
ncbi:MAG: hypothetical protein QNJ65_13210 [Xenococcaceae cyanobacterium MO_234.B1]|nr:hypothetical protein [Xenococcaceae cyanobacterium MO_234.B1]